jgi:HK97 family phage portal protein
MAFFFETNLGDIFSSTAWRNMLGRPSRNNQYIYQPDFTIQPLNLDKQEQWITIDGNEREIYLTTAELRIVIDRLATMFSNGMWKEFDSQGNEVDPTTSDVIKLLENPNIYQSRNEYLIQWFVQRCLYANTFVYQLKGSSFQDIPSALWNLSPSLMQVNRTGKIWDQSTLEGIISGYTFQDTYGNANQQFETDEVIHFTIPNPDDPIVGSSPLAAIRMALSNIRASYGYRNTVYTKKGAIGIWSVEGKDVAGSITLTDDEKKDMAQQLTRTYGIGDNQASVVIANKPVKWQAATYPMAQMELFKEVTEDFKAIIDIYGANEYMFTSGENAKGSTFTNVEMGERACYQNTLMPIAQDLANGLADRFGILERGGHLELCFDHLPILQEDKAKEAEVLERKANAAQTLLQNGYSPDEVNEMIGWDLTGGEATMNNTSDGQSE